MILKPIRTTKYHLEVQDMPKGSFKLVRQDMKQETIKYQDTLGVIYPCFVDAYEFGEDSFNNLCDMEFKDVNYYQ